jgi:hypothetical protein
VQSCTYELNPGDDKSPHTSNFVKVKKDALGGCFMGESLCNEEAFQKSNNKYLCIPVLAYQKNNPS